MGGMGLPSCRLYFWSCNIRCMSFWNGTLKSVREHMENQALLPNTLKSRLHYTSNLSKFKRQNLLVSDSLKIWSQIKRHFQWNHCSVLIPLTGNQEHRLSSSNIFKQWDLKGVHTIMDLFIDKLFPTSEQLS